MQPLYDNLGVIQNQYALSESKHRRISAFLQEEKLVIAPLAYIRGRSLVKIFFIVDEAQNLTPHEVKTIITRAGEGTKIVFTGDIYQIDHPYLDSQANGLSYLIEKMQGESIYAHVNLEKVSALNWPNWLVIYSDHARINRYYSRSSDSLGYCPRMGPLYYYTFWP